MLTTLLVMTLNEIDGMKEIMPRLNSAWVDQILIVDGGSTDGTIEWARENGYTVHVQSTPGFRQAYNEALPLCIGEVIITFSPDGNSIPEHIPLLVNEIKKGYDMVIVSRYLGDAKSLDDTFLTGLGNRFFTKSINFFHNSNYTDAMGIYRAYKIDLVEKLGLQDERWYRLPEALFFCRGLSWEPLLSILAGRENLQISEIPGDEPPRISGESRVMPNMWARIQWAGVFYYQILLALFIK